MKLLFDTEISSLRENIKKTMPDNPVLAGWSSFSQCDEDGIIRECLSRVYRKTPGTRTCIEIGCANGLENNTHQLLLDGYSGFWVDADQANISHICEQLGGLRFAKLLVVEQSVDLENVRSLVDQATHFLGTADVDFLSLDVDGNDFHLLAAILGRLNPKLICVEYNAKFPPPDKRIMKYNPRHQWEGDDYFGASLQAWVELMRGYSAICCNLSGSNAFFIRSEIKDQFTIYSTSEIYQPPRYWLATGPTGHKSSLKWLRQLVSP